MTRNRILAFFSWFLLAGSVMAQPCSLRIEGRVLDRASREPLGFAMVGVPEQAQGALADSTGYFTLAGLCPGPCHVQVNHIGCEPYSIFIDLVTDTILELRLDHHPELLREVRIEGGSSAYQVSQSQQSIPEGKLRQVAGRPLAEIIADVAGVRALRTGSGIAKPVIHGLSGNRVAVVNNGVFQAGQQWGVDHAPEIDPNSANLVRIIKGADAIEYGSRALGGAVVVEAGSIPDDPHIHGTTGYSLATNGWQHALFGRLRQSMGPFAWRFTGTVKRGGDTRAPGYYLANTGVSETNASLQGQWKPSMHTRHEIYYSLFSTRLGIFSGSHISNLTDLEEALQRDRPYGAGDRFSYALEAPKQHVTHHLVRYSGNHFLTDENFWAWSVALQHNHRKEFDIRRGDRSDIPALDLALWSSTADLRFVHGRGAFPYQVGLQGTYSDNSNDYDTGILPLIPDYREGVAGVFAKASHAAGPWQLEAGGRYDWQVFRAWTIPTDLPRRIVIRDRVYHDGALSLGASIRYGKAETRLHQSLVIRSPEINELYSNGLHQGVAGIEEGSPDLIPETGFQATLSQSLELHHKLHVGIDLFSHWLANYIYLEPQDELRLTIRGAFPVFRYRQQDAWLRGIDLVVLADLSDQFSLTAKASGMWGTDLASSRALPMIPPWLGTAELSWSPGSGDRRTATRMTLAGEYTARQAHWDPEAELAAPPGDYFLVNLRIDTGWKSGGGRTWFTGIAVENLLNVRYRNYLNRLRYFADETGRNLVFRVRLEF